MKTAYLQLTEQFKKHKILVIGDFMIDAYYKGTCTRLAPEAPVPVVDIYEKCYCLGGAANAAANLKALGAEVLFCTVTGKDEIGVKGVELLTAAGISTKWMVKDAQRKTLLKTRIMTATQPLVRFDEGTLTKVEAAAETLFLAHIRNAYAACDAVLIADYDKGVLSEAVISCLMELKKKTDKMIAVDAKRLPSFAMLKPDMVKPNYEELLKMLGLPFQNTQRKVQLQSYGDEIYRHTQAGITAVTLDEEGSLLFKGNELICDTPASLVKSRQVSGAGDTYCSAFFLALLSGAKVEEMAAVATAAATIAIEKENTAICYNEELKMLWEPAKKYIGDQNSLKNRCKWHHNQGKRIVFTNGCFDILHSGHVSYLNQAKERGDILIVGLNTDESIKRLKGKTRPLNSLVNRVEVLSALSCIDYIVPFGSLKDDTPINLIKMVKPDVFAKGGDYKNTKLPEAALLEKIGCEIVFLPYIAHQSTTNTIKKMDPGMRMKIALMN